MTKKIKKKKKSKIETVNSVFGPVKFEASMEYPSEKAHGVIISVVFGAQIRGLLRNRFEKHKL